MLVCVYLLGPLMVSDALAMMIVCICTSFVKVWSFPWLCMALWVCSVPSGSLVQCPCATMGLCVCAQAYDMTLSLDQRQLTILGAKLKGGYRALLLFPAHSSGVRSVVVATSSHLVNGADVPVTTSRGFDLSLYTPPPSPCLLSFSSWFQMPA